jgi:hypothetical protein
MSCYDVPTGFDRHPPNVRGSPETLQKHSGVCPELLGFSRHFAAGLIKAPGAPPESIPGLSGKFQSLEGFSRDVKPCVPLNGLRCRCAPGVQEAVCKDYVGSGLDAPSTPLHSGPQWPRCHAPILLACLNGLLSAEGLHNISVLGLLFPAATSHLSTLRVGLCPTDLYSDSSSGQDDLKNGQAVDIHLIPIHVVLAIL